MTRLRALLITLSVLSSIVFLPAPASAAMVTIDTTNFGGGNCADDGTWGFYITMVGAVAVPNEIKASIAGGGTLTIPWTRTDNSMAFYETQAAAKLTGEATAQIDEAWKARKGIFVVGWGPCAATTMEAATAAPVVVHGSKIRFTGRLTGADGQGLGDRTANVRLHSIDADGQGKEFGPFKTGADGRFTLDVKADSYGPIHLTGEYNGRFPIDGAEHAASETAMVWSLPATPVSAHAALASSAGSAFGPDNRRTTVSGNGFEPNADIGILLFSEPRLLAAFHADDAGAFSGEVTLPDGVSGEHRLVAAGIDAGHEQIRYLDLTVTVSGGGLPLTGAPVWMLAAYAAVPIVLGLFIVVRTGRRPQK